MTSSPASRKRDGKVRTSRGGSKKIDSAEKRAIGNTSGLNLRSFDLNGKGWNIQCGAGRTEKKRKKRRPYDETVDVRDLSSCFFELGER